jgi:predicted Rossmann fold flavoprotein
MQFFRENGLELKTERGRRVFPCSDNANDVADLLESICRRRGVRMLCSRVTGITVQDGAVQSVLTDTGKIPCRSCIVCTGGLSYPLTGSTGDGYRFAESVGHTLTPPRPSLVPLICRETCCERMQGLSLRNVELRVYEDEKLHCREQGEMLFTHFVVSGPLVLSASARMRRFGASSYRLEIDMKPALDEKTLDRRLLRDFEKYQNRILSNALTDLLPHAMIPEVIAAAGASPDLPVHSLTREMRQRLVQTIKAFPLTVIGPRPVEEAIVTAGGIRTKEIDPRSMRSRRTEGLFFAGEVLDLDAYTGGYNLQIAWSTGRMAGKSAAQYAQRHFTETE